MLLGFDVTYGHALASTGYHRVTNYDNHAADIGEETFLWYHKWTSSSSASCTATGIMDLSISSDTTNIPQGYNHVEKSILRGKKVYLCYQMMELEDSNMTEYPIKRVHLFQSQDSIPSHYSKLVLYHHDEPTAEDESSKKLIFSILGYCRYTKEEWIHDIIQNVQGQRLVLGDPITIFHSKSDSWIEGYIFQLTITKFQMKHVQETQEVWSVKKWTRKIRFGRTKDSSSAVSRSFSALEFSASPSPSASSLSPQVAFSLTSKSADTWTVSELKRLEYYFQTQKEHTLTISPKDDDFYWDTQLPELILKILDASPNNHQAQKMEDFLNTTLACVVWKLSQIRNEEIGLKRNTSSFYMLQLILNGRSKTPEFYSSSSWSESSDLKIMAKSMASNKYAKWTKDRMQKDKKNATTVSPLYISNLNSFGELGGFEEALKRISNTYQLIALPELRLYAYIVMKGLPYCVSEFRSTFIHRWKTALFWRLRNISSVEFQRQYRVIEQILCAVEATLLSCSDASILAPALEALFLDMTIYFFQSSKMLHHTKGIRRLLKVVSCIDPACLTKYQQKHVQFQAAIKEIPSSLTFSSISKQFAVQWMEKNHIVSSILVYQSTTTAEKHCELIQLALPILSFYALKLTSTDFQKLWEMPSFGNDQEQYLGEKDGDSDDGNREANIVLSSKGIKQIKYYMLTQLLHYLSYQQLIQAIYPWIKDWILNLDQVYDFEIDFLTQFNLILLRHWQEMERDQQILLMKEHQDIYQSVWKNTISGYWELLWSWKNTPAGTRNSSSQFQYKVQNSFRTILQFPIAPMSPLLGLYLERCVEKLFSEKHEVENGLDAMTYMRMLLQDLPHKTADGSTQNKTSEMIDQVYLSHGDLLSRVISILVSYSSISSSSSPKLSNVKACLSFLEFLTGHSGIQMPFEAINQLWAIFTHADQPKSHADLFFQWLSQLLVPCFHPKKCHAISEDTIKHVFQQLLLNQQDMGSVSMSSFLCFEGYFRFVNGKAGLISKFHSTAEFLVDSMELKGVDCLWKMLNQSSSSEITAMIMNHLMQVHFQTGPELATMEVWKDFVTCILDHFQSESSDEYKCALLELLMQFVYHIESGYTTPSMASTIDPAAPPQPILEVLVRVRSLSIHQSSLSSQNQYYIRGNRTIGELRDRISHKVGHPADQIRLLPIDSIPSIGDQCNSTMPNKHLSATYVYKVQTHNRMTLLQANVRQFHAILLSQPESDTKDHHETIKIDSMSHFTESNSRAMEIKQFIVQSQKYVSMLLEGLRLNSMVSEKIWKLFTYLPKNESMQKKLSTIFESILPSSSIETELSAHTLSSSTVWQEHIGPFGDCSTIYALEAIEDLSNYWRPKPIPPSWCHSFLSNNGQEYLHQHFMYCDFHALLAGSIGRKCLIQLLSLITFYWKLYFSFEKISTSFPAKLKELLNTTVLCMTKVKTSSVISSEITAASQSRVDHYSENHDAEKKLYGLSRPFFERVTFSRLPNFDESTEASYEMVYQSALITLHQFFHHVSPSIHDCHQLVAQEHEVNNRIYGFGLFHAQSMELRQTVSDYLVAQVRSITNHCSSSSEDDSRWILTLFIEFSNGILQDGDNLNLSSLEYFDSWHQILQSCSAIIPLEQIQDMIQVLWTLLTLYPSQEHTKNQSSDSVLQVLLQCLLSCLQIWTSITTSENDEQPLVSPSFEEDFIHALMQEILFAPPYGTSLNFSSSREKKSQSTASSRYHQVIELPKCKHPDTRKMAWAVLFQFTTATRRQNSVLFQYLHEYHAIVFSSATGMKSPGSIMEDVMSTSRSTTPMGEYHFAGLINMGCTCYYNAIIQILFMIPSFRQGIMAIPSTIDEGSLNINETNTSVVHQLQLQFGMLSATQHHSCDSTSFFQSFKDWQGQLMNVLQQQDASEFVNNLFQQIDSHVNGTPYEHILKDCFGGTLYNELLDPRQQFVHSPTKQQPMRLSSTQHPENTSKRHSSEPFYYLSVQVCNSSNLDQSLKHLIQCEFVDYTWKQEDEEKHDQNHTKKTKAKSTTNTEQEDNDKTFQELEPKTTFISEKKMTIDKTPHHLWIHLKRFEFDFKSMSQQKINDRFEFPMEMDIFPYTTSNQHTQNLAPSSISDHTEYQYELIAIVMHAGTAHSGHYYSLIRQQEQWYEFNDTDIIPFQSDQIPEKCFGSNVKTAKKSSHYESAFMLVYEKSSELKRKAIEASNDTLVDPFKCFSPAIRAHIQTQNQEIWSYLYFNTPGNNYFQSLLELGSLCNESTSASIQSKCEILFNWMCQNEFNRQNQKTTAKLPPRLKAKSNELELESTKQLKQNIKGWKSWYRRYLPQSSSACSWILSQCAGGGNVFETFLMQDTRAHVRESFLDLIVFASEQMVHQDSEGFHTLRHLVWDRMIVSSLPRLEAYHVQHQLTCEELYQLMYHMYQLGPAFQVLFHEQHILLHLLKIHCPAPYQRQLISASPERVTVRKVSWSVILTQLFYHLICSASPPFVDTTISSHEDDSPTPPTLLSKDNSSNNLDRETVAWIESCRFTEYCLEALSPFHKHREMCSHMILHLCYESQHQSDVFLKVLSTGVELSDFDHLKHYFRGLYLLTKASHDSIAHSRLEDALMSVIAVMASQQRYYKATVVSIQMLVRGMRNHSVLRSLLTGPLYQPTLSWVEPWLDKHLKSRNPLQRGETLWIKNGNNDLKSDHTSLQQAWARADPNQTEIIETIQKELEPLVEQWRNVLTLTDWRSNVEYDSDDDPHRLVGQRVELKWARNKWYRGQVEAYNPDSGQHFITYDDGDTRSYQMWHKTFRLLTSDKRSKPTRLSRLNRYINPKKKSTTLS